MKYSILLFVLLIAGTLTAQTKFTVIVAGGSFTPANITISAGDTVEYLNQAGTHWVDGTQGTFASNPVSFDNQAQSGAGWTYTEVFNTVGAYDYRCGIHTTTMFGTITVQTPAAIIEPAKVISAEFYPNPTTNQINFSNYENINGITIYSITGEMVLQATRIRESFDVSSLNSGTYFVKVVTDEEELTRKMIIK